MKFKIVDFNTSINAYLVMSDAGEQMQVSAEQIIKVMLQNYEFVNAYMTKKGFAIDIGNGRTKYIQLQNLNRDTYRAMAAKVETDREIAKHIAEEEAKPKVKLKVPVKKMPHSNNLLYGSINFRGKRYGSERELCEAFNRDYRTFKEMTEFGYSLEESLGLVTPRSKDEIVAMKIKVARELEILSRQRGE